MAIFGLMGTEQFASERFKSIRRQVLYFYPNGAAPLLGLLSMLKETVCNDPEYTHYEKILLEWRTTTPSSGSVLFDNTAQPGTVLSTGTNLVAGTSYQVAVQDTSAFRIGTVAWIKDVQVNGQSGPPYLQIKGRVTAISAQPGNGYLTFVALENYNNICAQTLLVNLNVMMVGTSFSQGALSGSDARYNLPMVFANACQIFRTPFSFTGTALKTSAKFDETGPYKDKAKEASLEHMISKEWAYIFGVYSKSVDPNSNLPTYTTGGLEWYLKQYENGIYGANTAVTTAQSANQDLDDNKRIIENTSGSMNEKFYDTLLERLFRVTNNKANDKLVLCGSGFLNVIDQMYKSKVNLMGKVPLTETYGMNVVEHQCPFGRLYYKTHPLFSQNPFMRYSAFALDVNNLGYRYVNGRDDELLVNRQPNDADYRKDEWFSETGFECNFPQSHMYLKNVNNYTP